MTTRAAVLALLFSALSSSALAKPPAKPRGKKEAPSPRNPSACLRFSQRTDSDKKLLRFSLVNRCQEALHCSVSWEVRCDGDAEPRARIEGSDLEGGAGQQLEASWAVCGDSGWHISPAQWRCSFPTLDTAVAGPPPGDG